MPSAGCAWSSISCIRAVAAVKLPGLGSPVEPLELLQRNRSGLESLGGSDHLGPGRYSGISVTILATRIRHIA